MPDKPLPAETSKPLRKGALIRVIREQYLHSLESQASDMSSASYIFEGPGEILAVKGEYCQVRWRMPVPDVWVRTDQLEPWS